MKALRATEKRMAKSLSKNKKLNNSSTNGPGAAKAATQSLLRNHERHERARKFGPQKTQNKQKSLAAVALPAKASVFALSFQL